MSTAQKYRKKPVEIEAMQWDGTVTEGQEIMHWAAKASGMAVPPEYPNDTPRGPVGIHTPRGLDPYLSIITLEGTMTARPGDFIIRGVQGEFYPCKPDIFEQTYEEALTPTGDEREALAKLIDEIDSAWLTGEDRSPYPSEMAHELARRGVRFGRTEVPEPSAEVLSDWFTSSHGVAVAAVKPMTDRGPSVMVDGRVISPNDVAALIEFKAQGEPSDAQVLAALNAYNDDSDAALRDWSPYKVNAMRAALRAAGDVR